MSLMFWLCMRCGKHARGTAQEISDYCLEHMCETGLNDSNCDNCATKFAESTSQPSTSQPSISSEEDDSGRDSESPNPKVTIWEP